MGSGSCAHPHCTRTRVKKEKNCNNINIQRTKWMWVYDSSLRPVTDVCFNIHIIPHTIVSIHTSVRICTRAHAHAHSCTTYCEKERTDQATFYFCNCIHISLALRSIYISISFRMRYNWRKIKWNEKPNCQQHILLIFVSLSLCLFFFLQM